MESGERLGGRIVTDRRARGPVFDVVALAVDDKPTHLALCFPEEVRAHPWFGEGLREHVQSLAWPGVLGVAALVQAEAERGVLVYETGPAVPLAHVFERLATEGRPLGVRASLELAYLCTDILAQSNGSLGPHGQISPWTVGLTRRGRAVLLGYGVPCLELDLDQPGTGFTMREDALRYAPPERFSHEPQGLTSDLFSLWLLVAEGVLGRPLYDGVLEDLRHLARRGEAATRWFPHRDEVSAELHEQITAGLKPDADARPRDAEQLVHDLYGLARRFDADGPSLADVLHALGEGEPDVPLPSPGIGTANAIQALDPDARWEGRSAKSLYDPTTGVTEMDRTSVADPENDVTEVSSASRARADRREALRERLKSDPSTTTAIHGMTDYVTLDPIDESKGPGQGTTAIVERPDIAPSAPPADVRWQVVSHRGRAVRVPVFDTDRVATVALRAAMEHGALSVDTSGKLLGGWAIAQGGQTLTGSLPVSRLAAGPVELVRLKSELRLITVEVQTTPPVRFQSPTSLTMPAAWLVAGIADWLRLPEGPWTAFVDGRPVERDVPLADVLGDRDHLVIAPRVRPTDR